MKSSLLPGPIGGGMVAGGSSDPNDALPVYAWTPADIPGAVFWLPTANLTSMFVEDDATTLETRPTNGSRVGWVDEPMGSWHLTSGATDTYKPTLATDATQLSYLTFALDGAADSLLDAINTKKSLRFFQKAMLGTILVKVKFAGAAGNYSQIVGTNKASGGIAGWHLRRDQTTGTITFVVADGFGTIGSITTTAAILDTNWHMIRVWCDGTNRIPHIRIDNAVGENGSEGARALSDVDNLYDLRIGCRQDDQLYPMRGNVADLVITNTVVSNADYALWAAYNPAQNSDTLARIYAAGHSLTPAQVSHVQIWYDFDDLATMWTTSAKAAQVAVTADPIGYVENKKTIPTNCGSFERQAIQATAAKRPLWDDDAATATQGGALFAGATSDINTHAGENCLELNEAFNRGAGTMIVAFKNTRAVSGSHIFWVNNSSYLAMGGSGHTTPANRGVAVLHPITGTAMNTTVSPNGGDAWNIVARSRTGLNGRIFMNNVLGDVTTDMGIMPMSHIGRAAALDWDMAGPIAAVLVCNVAHSDVTIKKLCRGFATTLGIANVA